ncbi:MAG: SUF system Fe-S cluster assembly regulator [Gammaproteobacteria bacterium]|nr:SUF system Fe-S cluster assembly regulator [Gammaproteobacteria bacterium]
MLRISKLADYGTVVMVYLARHAKLCNAKEIAHSTRLALPTVSKLLKQLTHAGLLVSERGAGGGYRLQREAGHISVADVVYAVDEKRGLTECSVHGSCCVLESVCSVKGNWRLISQAVELALQSVTLAALALPVIDQKVLSQMRSHMMASQTEIVERKGE